LPAFVDDLKASIYDSSPFVAAMAARLLAHEVGAEIAPDLCKSLDRFHNFRTWYLVDMMVAMGPGAVPSIRGTLANPKMPDRTRAVAAHALSVLWDLESGGLAAKLLREEKNAEFLTSLLRLLGQVGTPEHLPAVRTHLDSQEFFVRAAATRTLSELGTEKDLPLLVEKLGDPSSWVKMAAARGIYRIGGKAALTALSREEDPASPWFRQVLGEEGGR
jgi:HEAT repeat protein